MSDNTTQSPLRRSRDNLVFTVVSWLCSSHVFVASAVDDTVVLDDCRRRLPKAQISQRSEEEMAFHCQWKVQAGEPYISSRNIQITAHVLLGSCWTRTFERGKTAWAEKPSRRNRILQQYTNCCSEEAASVWQLKSTRLVTSPYPLSFLIWV